MGIFFGGSEVSSFFSENNSKRFYSKNGWTGLLDIMSFWIGASESIKRRIFQSMRGCTQNFENFHNDFPQKRLEGPLRYYDFCNQRIEIYQTGMFFFADQRCHPEIWKISKWVYSTTAERPSQKLWFWNQRIKICQWCMYLFRLIRGVTPNLRKFSKRVNPKTAGRPS